MVRETGDRQEIDLNRNGQLARESRQEEDRSLQHSDHFEVSVAVADRDFGSHFLKPLVDLLAGQQNPLDHGKGRSLHAGFPTPEGASPYFKTSSCKSF